MSKPEERIAVGLADELAAYGELPVRVALHDADDIALGTAKLVRLEVGFEADGSRYIGVTGYLE